MRLGSLLVVVLFGCGGAASKPATGSPPLPQLPPPGNDPGVAPAEAALPSFPDGPGAALTVVDRPAHERARAAALAGNWHEAKRLLGHLVLSYPEHPLLLAQYNAVAAHVEHAQAAAKADLETIPLRTPPAPPAGYALVRAAPAGNGEIPKLVKKHEKPNGITDDEKWFQENDLRLPQYFVEPPGGTLWLPALLSSLLAAEIKVQFAYVEYPKSGRYLQAHLPLEVPPAYGSLALDTAIDSNPYLVASYGHRVVVVFDEKKKVVAAFDLQNFAKASASVSGKAKVGRVSLTTAAGTRTGDLTVATESIDLELRYALAADGVLYVEHLHNGYTKDAKGQTGYLTAFDLGSGEMLWHSAPQVCNVQNFIVLGGALVCGYGFTAEPRYLTVIDRATGVTKQKTQISTTPDLFVPKGESIYVRGYRNDFVFAVK